MNCERSPRYDAASPAPCWLLWTRTAGIQSAASGRRCRTWRRDQARSALRLVCRPPLCRHHRELPAVQSPVCRLVLSEVDRDEQVRSKSCQNESLQYLGYGRQVRYRPVIRWWWTVEAGLLQQRQYLSTLVAGRKLASLERQVSKSGDHWSKHVHAKFPYVCEHCRLFVDSLYRNYCWIYSKMWWGSGFF